MTTPPFSSNSSPPALRISRRFLPFADVLSDELPLSRLLRLSLFQFTAGMALVLLNGTLNRVMVIELGIPVSLVAMMVALPVMFAPLRALIGHRSDQYRSVLGCRRVPFIWGGTLAQFGGFAIMPFALILLSGDSLGPAWLGTAAAALAFLLVGAGMHTAQTAGLALATDIAPEANRPRVVAMLYLMLLVGMMISSFVFAALLQEFTQLRLIKVVQGAAAVTIVLNVIALWKQEARQPDLTRPDRDRPSFAQSWHALNQQPHTVRLLIAVALGTLGFSMQDILLEPYGGQVLGLSVSATTALTALFAAGMIAAFTLSSRRLGDGADPIRLAGYGTLVGIFAFAAVILSSPLDSPALFRLGTFFIGFGGGFFAVGTLIAVMSLNAHNQNGIALGAWGAVQASAAGLAIAAGGGIRDLVAGMALNGTLGSTLSGTSVGYGAVYYLEIFMLFAALIALGPLANGTFERRNHLEPMGMPEFPA